MANKKREQQRASISRGIRFPDPLWADVVSLAAARNVTPNRVIVEAAQLQIQQVKKLEEQKK